MRTTFVQPLGLTMCFFVAAPCAAAERPPVYEWEQVTLAAPFAARDGAGALSFAGRTWLLGGWNPGAADRQFFPRTGNNMQPDVWRLRRKP